MTGWEALANIGGAIVITVHAIAFAYFFAAWRDRRRPVRDIDGRWRAAPSYGRRRR
jgi:hypothetical protein